MTFEEFELWRAQRPGERYEFIDRAPVRLMAETEAHGDAVDEIGRQFHEQLPRGAPCRVRVQNCALKIGEDQFEPDVVIHCGDRDPSRVFITDPAVVIEVTSDSTRRRDYFVKMPAYERIEGLAAAILIDLKVGAIYVSRPGEPVQEYARDDRIEMRLLDDSTITLDCGCVFAAANLSPIS